MVYDQSLGLIETLDMPEEMKEGWGMTHYVENNKQYLLTSDGTNKLFHIDPEDFKVVKTVEVFHQNGNPLRSINE